MHGQCARICQVYVRYKNVGYVHTPATAICSKTLMMLPLIHNQKHIWESEIWIGLNSNYIVTVSFVMKALGHIMTGPYEIISSFYLISHPVWELDTSFFSVNSWTALFHVVVFCLLIDMWRRTAALSVSLMNVCALWDEWASHHALYLLW